MDEPFGALDPVTRDALGRAYRALHDRLGLTTVMVTHDVQEAVLLADRIVVMRDGAIVADGDAARHAAPASIRTSRAMFEASRRQAARIATLSEPRMRRNERAVSRRAGASCRNISRSTCC